MTSSAADDIAARVSAVRDRIARACERASRDPAGVTLIAVTKTHPAETVAAALQAGLTNFGENRVQEGVAKVAAVRDLLPYGAAHPAWHLIGHLQTNKVRAALGAFAILHSVDSERLLRAISGAAQSPVQVFLEVNVAAEPQKYGTDPASLPGFVELARTLPNLELRGLMTVAPHVDDPEAARPVFRSLRELAAQHGLAELSMGMTDDFEVAIEEGSTHVRVGRALFGERA